MTNRIFRIAAATAMSSALVFGVAAHAGATGDPCGGVFGHDTVPLNQPSLGIVPIGGAFYLDVRNVDDDGALFSIWVYQETNGIADLQRGGKAGGPTGDIVNTETAAEPGGNPDGDVETCQESQTPDTLIY